jgi:hypothetical protein
VIIVDQQMKLALCERLQDKIRKPPQKAFLVPFVPTFFMPTETATSPIGYSIFKTFVTAWFVLLLNFGHFHGVELVGIVVRIINSGCKMD